MPPGNRLRCRPAGSRRYAADRRLQRYGIAAISFAIGFLVLLIGTLVLSGYTAFVQTKVRVAIDLTTAEIDPDDIQRRPTGVAIVRGSLAKLEPDLEQSQQRAYFSMFTSSARFLVRDHVIKQSAV